MTNKAGIAQLVEQWIENPRVSSSNLDPGSFLNLNGTEFVESRSLIKGH